MSKSFSELLKITVKMDEILTDIKTLYGDDWKEKSNPFRREIERSMKGQKITNPLRAILPLAKGIIAQGHNPIILLAVAIEMSKESNSCPLCGFQTGGGICGECACEDDYD